MMGNCGRRREHLGHDLRHGLTIQELAALEHAREPGADPALLVLAQALEERLVQALDRA